MIIITIKYLSKTILRVKYAQILGGFNKGVKESTGKSDWKSLEKELEKTRKAIEAETKLQQKLEKTNRKLLEERKKLMEKAKNSAPNSAYRKKAKKDLAENEKAFKANWARMQGSIEKTTEGHSSLSDITEELEGSKGFKGLAKQMGSSLGETQVLGVSLGDMATAMGGGAIAVGLLATMAAELTRMTYEMMKEQNEGMVNLERSTGGMITASKLGADRFGQMEGGITTLTDAARWANVSFEQFADSLTTFTKSTGGNIVGSGDIAKQKTAMVDLGIWGARIKKLYGTDIIPAVSTLFRNWGQDSVMALTDMMHDGVMEAKAQGLDPEQFAKNMEDVGKLAGKLSFKGGVKGMKDMAMYATKMGTSVDSIADGFTDMGSFTDIFEKQAKMAAMGFNNLGASLGRVYGQRMSGDALGAYQTEKSAVLQDVMQKGGVDESGEINTMGVKSLEAIGWKQEQIAELQKASIAVKQYGLSVKQATGPLEEFPDSVKAAMLANEMNNKTLGEQWDQSIGNFKAGITDFLALGLKPALDWLTGWLSKHNSYNEAADTYFKARRDGVDLSGINEKYSGGKERGFLDKLGTATMSVIKKPISAVGSIFTDTDFEKDLKSQWSEKYDIDPDNMSAEQLAQYTKEVKAAQDEFERNKGRIDAHSSALETNTDIVKENTKSIAQQMDDEKAKRKLFARANMGAILDSATRDLVKYGSVAQIKKMSVPDVNTQFNQQQQNQQTVSTIPNPAPVVKTTVKVDPVTGKTDAKTASYVG